MSRPVSGKERSVSSLRAAARAPPGCSKRLVCSTSTGGSASSESCLYARRERHLRRPCSGVCAVGDVASGRAQRVCSIGRAMFVGSIKQCGRPAGTFQLCCAAGCCRPGTTLHAKGLPTNHDAARDTVQPCMSLWHAAPPPGTLHALARPQLLLPREPVQAAQQRRGRPALIPRQLRRQHAAGAGSSVRSVQAHRRCGLAAWQVAGGCQGVLGGHGGVGGLGCERRGQLGR